MRRAPCQDHISFDNNECANLSRQCLSICRPHGENWVSPNTFLRAACGFLKLQKRHNALTMGGVRTHAHLARCNTIALQPKPLPRLVTRINLAGERTRGIPLGAVKTEPRVSAQRRALENFDGCLSALRIIQRRSMRDEAVLKFQHASSWIAMTFDSRPARNPFGDFGPQAYRSITTPIKNDPQGVARDCFLQFAAIEAAASFPKSRTAPASLREKNPRLSSQSAPLRRSRAVHPSIWRISPHTISRE